MPFDPAKPYNDLPDLPPSIELETHAVLKACIEARTALARLAAEAGQLPNPLVLVGSAALLEAKDSSAIENIVTTEDALFRHDRLSNPAADPATKEALNYRTALFAGLQSIKTKPLSTATAVQTCSILLGRDIGIRKLPGTVLRNERTGAVIYTPPVGEDVIRAKLANWEKFVHANTELDPLVRLSVQHYQFEAIHPFHDGNGRTGRILNILQLIDMGLLNQPILYLSRQILESRDAYYWGLLAVTTNQAWPEWLECFLLMISLSATKTSAQIANARILMLQAEIHLRTSAPKIASRELIEVIFSQPYCRIRDLVEAGIAGRQTASTYLKALTNLGMLQELKIGRELVFYNERLALLLANREHEIVTYMANRLQIDPPLMFPPTAARAS